MHLTLNQLRIIIDGLNLYTDDLIESENNLDLFVAATALKVKLAKEILKQTADKTGAGLCQ